MSDISSTKIDTLHKIKKIDNAAPYQMAEIKDSIFIKNFPPYIGDNGNWFEFDINKGLYINTGVQAKGEKGDKGDNGTTPIKGVDYFTNEDITEIKNEVVSTIPAPLLKLPNLLMIAIL